MDELSAKKCLPCSSTEVRSMTEQAARELISQVPEWELVNEAGRLKLSRSWKVKTFLKGLEFFQAVANVAEAEVYGFPLSTVLLNNEPMLRSFLSFGLKYAHHPDLHLAGYNNVKIEIWTHVVGGITESDFILAAKINKLNLHHLVRSKASK